MEKLKRRKKQSSEQLKETRRHVFENGGRLGGELLGLGGREVVG